MPSCPFARLCADRSSDGRRGRDTPGEAQTAGADETASRASVRRACGPRPPARCSRPRLRQAALQGATARSARAGRSGCRGQAAFLPFVPVDPPSGRRDQYSSRGFQSVLRAAGLTSSTAQIGYMKSACRGCIPGSFGAPKSSQVVEPRVPEAVKECCPTTGPSGSRPRGATHRAPTRARSRARRRRATRARAGRSWRRSR